MDMIIRDGRVVSPTGIYRADVAVNGGKIAAVGDLNGVKADKEVSAHGLYVLPGAIDVHTHLAAPFQGGVSADGYMSGTRAAVCGGTTTVFDYPVQHKGQTIHEVVNEKKQICEKEACSDYAFHCAITDFNGGDILDEMSDAVADGIASFKCYLVYKKEGQMADDGMLVRLMLRGKELGAMINVHAENPDLIDVLTEKYASEGKLSPWYHYMSRPEFVAAEADKRVVHWAAHLDAPVYIVHMSDKEGLLACLEAKAHGVPVYVETCPQYLAFTCDVYKREDGRNFVCSPPMKGEESRQALWQAVKDGTLDVVATDHCPFMSYEKDWGKDDFRKIPNGCAGIENRYPYMLDAANRGVISFERAVELCAANPARIFGCPSKGTLDPGKDADIVLYDPETDFTVHTSNMHSDYDHTIWEGIQMHGYPVQTYLRGKLVYDHGSYVGNPGDGKFIKRVPVMR